MSWTDEMYRLAGLVPQSVMVTPRLWLDVTHPADRQRVAAALTEAFTRPGPFELAQRMMLTSGEVRHLAVRGEVEHDANGRPVRVWGSAQDVTERHRVQEELRRTALTDPLTGLGNRLLLVDRLRRSIAALDGAAGQAGHVAVIAVDLDGLKRVNDTYGHTVGDAVLRELSRRVAACVREVDTVARYGGEEFVVITPETDTEGALRLAARICEAIREAPFIVGDDTVIVTVSIGVASLPGHGISSGDLVRAADDGLYAAKRAGRDQYQLAPLPTSGSTATRGDGQAADDSLAP